MTQNSLDIQMQTRLNIDQRNTERGYIFKHNGNGGNLKKSIKDRNILTPNLIL